MNLAVSNPNFSIVVPTGCNAKCNFCFWTKSEKCLPKREYLRRLQTVLQDLPCDFTQCSITGGEPTTCDFLRDILVLVRLRFDKVVLSTNGFKVEPWVFDYIDHLNISRHHHDDLKNEQIFGTSTVPNWLGIQDICNRANNVGVDVTINTVVHEDFHKKSFLHNMLDFVRSVEANAICFRKEHGNLDPLPIEKELPKIVYEHGCGVCLVKERYIRGIKTTWRYSVLEPSQDLGAVYELVMQPDGVVTRDWEATQPEFWFADTRYQPYPVEPTEDVDYDEGCTCNETPEHTPICPACEDKKESEFEKTPLYTGCGIGEAMRKEKELEESRKAVAIAIEKARDGEEILGCGGLLRHNSHHAEKIGVTWKEFDKILHKAQKNGKEFRPVGGAFAAASEPYYATGQPDMRGCNGEMPGSCGRPAARGCGSRGCG